MQCGHLSLGKPRWKCSFCREVVAGLPSKPVSVFTRVKRSSGSVVNQFARNILDNLSFKINNNEVSIEVFKCNNEPAVATFVVSSVPAGDVPLPVKVYEDNIKTETKDYIHISDAAICEDDVDTFVVPLKVLKDDFKHVPKNKVQDSEAAIVDISGDMVTIVDVPLQVKVLKDDPKPKTRNKILEFDDAVVISLIPEDSSGS